MITSEITDSKREIYGKLRALFAVSPTISLWLRIIH